MTEPVHIISLGAGVQSSTMALMAACGEVGPMPKAAIFADTQAEPASVYKWLDWLETQLPFPVIRVTAGSLTEGSLRIGYRKEDGRPWIKGNVPAFVTKEDGSVGPLWRTCTADYKIAPLQREAKKLIGYSRKNSTAKAVIWIGISLDEVHRMKPSREKWSENIWPLIDKRMTRWDCLRWMEKNGYPVPPRSACTYCPFHSDAEWHRLKTQEPEAFASAVEFERRLQAASVEAKCHQGTLTLHRSGLNIDQVIFDQESQAGQQELFGNECEGLCGV
jgi:hypothetical protein